jgi:hypothetical protein
MRQKFKHVREENVISFICIPDQCHSRHDHFRMQQRYRAQWKCAEWFRDLFYFRIHSYRFTEFQSEIVSPPYRTRRKKPWACLYCACSWLRYCLLRLSKGYLCWSAKNFVFLPFTGISRANAVNAAIPAAGGWPLTSQKMNISDL